MMCVIKVWTICLAIPFLSAVQGEDIYLTSYPSPANFQPGGTVNIICLHSTSFTFDHILHPTAGIISVSMGRFQIRTYRDEATLSITNAMESDEGHFKCVLRNGAATVESGYLETFFHLPIVLTPPRQGGNITVAAGDSFNLTCAGEHYSLRQWVVLRPSDTRLTALANTSDGRIALTHDEVLVFQGITAEDEGVYTCVLRSDVSIERIVANVTIVVRPVTSVTPAVQVVEEGATANFSCHVTGTPLPRSADVTWRDPNNMEIITSTAQSLGLSIQEVVRTETYLISTLTFASVSGRLTGQYTCRAVNSHGVNSSTGYIRLEGTPDPPANVRLALLNYTNLLVTWGPPNAEVTHYVVTWEAVTGSSALEDPQSAMVDSGNTSYIITDLNRLTTYSVSVHGSNSHGVGMVSSPVSATTTATVPSAPMSVAVFNIGPDTVHVGWPDSALPTDDGGSPLTNVRLTYRAMVNGMWPDAWSREEVIVGVEDMFAVVSDLRNETTYQIRLECRNEIGYGPGTASVPFVTLPPGHPGSPSQVVARNLTEDSAVVCWKESAFGGPFTLYIVEIHESGATKPVELIFRPTHIVSFPNCSTGVVVSDLQPGTCYRFVVYVTNSQSEGDRSPISEDYCSASISSCDQGALCDQEAFVLSTEAIAGIGVGSVVFLAVLFAIIACVALRQYKKSSLQKSVNVYMDDDSGSKHSDQSLRSTTGLLPGSTRTSSFDSCLPPISADSSQQSPETATSILSNPEQNPFDFSRRAGPDGHVVLHSASQPVLHTGSQPVLHTGSQPVLHTGSQPVLHPHQVATAMDYPQGMVSVNDHYPMYPILEDPPPYPHHVTRVFPSLAQPLSRQHLPRYVAPGHMTDHGVIIMTDNPNYEEEQIRGIAFRGEVPRKYYSNQMSDAADNEVSVNPLQIPTPHFGESYSQSGYSPVLQRGQDVKTAPDSVKREDSGTGSSQDDSQIAREHGVNLTTQKSSHSDEGYEDDDLEFVENDAYVTFAVPKFEIVSEERGSVFETVKVKGLSG